MQDETYYVVKTTSVVKAKNKSNARTAINGDQEAGQVLLQKIEVDEKQQSEIAKIVSTLDNNIGSLEQEADQNTESELSEYSSFLTVNEEVVDFLRSENKRLAKLAEKNKHVKQETVTSVYQAAFDAFSSFEMPKVKVKDLKNNKHHTPEVAIAVLSDWQMGKVTPTYNTEVLEKRIELYTEKLIEITTIQRLHHNVDELHVWLLGDIVEGEEIFAGQSHLIDSGLYRQVGVNGPRILSRFLITALENFKKVHVTGVIGNHGAVGGKMRKSHDPETNMDRLLYKILELMFAKEERITFNIPDGKGERNWYAVDRIGDYGCLLIHGDQMPSPSQFYGYYKKVMGWKDEAIPENFDDVYMGHYHQKFKMTIGSSTVRISGSPESHNTYAQEYFNSMSRPCQDLLYVHPNNGVTAEYTIWLDSA